MGKTSFPKDKIKFLLLEGIHNSALETLAEAGYAEITHEKAALEESELIARIGDYHFIGIRSRTKITDAVLEAADKLLAVGCFCIGTNQVDLHAAAVRAIPVFNAPHSNTRSVAELVLSEIIALSRGLADKSAAVHRGEWPKSAVGSFEVRHKKLGIIGYGHIGSQLSILAEALGMKVYYYDAEPKLPMGNATQLNSMTDLLGQCDFISLHVPAAASTVNLMDADAIKAMKKGSCLINASRGNVVDIDALASALEAGDLGGAAVDVFPKEPAGTDEAFESPLQNKANVILTPHIGGSTMEAQVNIGHEVATKFALYSDQGSTNGAVNFPAISLPVQVGGHHRVLHTHVNKPGILSAINQKLADSGVNILGQYLQTTSDVGYVVIDVESGKGREVFQQLHNIDGTLKCRILY